MSAIVIQINRTVRYSSSIGGQLYINGKKICYTLELPWKMNQKNISCIPVGIYTCFWRHDRYRIQCENIPCPEGTRTAIQIHPGNSPADSHGCILVGLTQTANWVGNSQKAMQKLIGAIFGDYCGPGFPSLPMQLKINNPPALNESDMILFDKLPGNITTYRSLLA